MIPEEIRDRIGLTKGTVLRVWIEGKKVVLEPLNVPPRGIFIEAGPEVTERILNEAK